MAATLEVAGTGFALWGGRATVLVTDPAVLPEVLDVVHLTLAEVDRAASSYRADSDLTRLNRAGGRPVQVRPLLREAIGVALRAAEATGGLVDPTVGAATLARSGAIARAGGRLVVDGWRRVQLDPVVGTVTLPRGVQLDLGATAKAWAADRCAALAAAAVADRGVGVLVSLAGDLAVAGPAPHGGFRVRVTDDHRTDPDDLSVPGTTVGLGSGGLATSSLTVRRVAEPGGGTSSHIVDPATGGPVAGRWRTVTVAAASCADANAASTAALIRGRSAAAWLDELGLPARLVTHAGDVTTVAGWPQEEED